MNPVEAWAALYRRGATLRVIAAATGYNQSHIRQSLLSHGVVLRSRGRPSGSRTLWHSEAMQLRAEGLTYREIGQRFGVSLQAAHQALTKLAR